MCRVLVASCSKKVGCELCSVLSGDVVHLDFHANRLVFQVCNLLFGLCVHLIFLRIFGSFSAFCRSVVSYITIRSEDYQAAKSEKNRLYIGGLFV